MPDDLDRLAMGCKDTPPPNWQQVVLAYVVLTVLGVCLGLIAGGLVILAFRFFVWTLG